MDSRVGWVSEKGRVADTVGDPVLRTPLEDGVPELIWPPGCLGWSCVKCIALWPCSSLSREFGESRRASGDGGWLPDSGLGELSTVHWRFRVPWFALVSLSWAADGESVLRRWPVARTVIPRPLPSMISTALVPLGDSVLRSLVFSTFSLMSTSGSASLELFLNLTVPLDSFLVSSTSTALVCSKHWSTSVNPRILSMLATRSRGSICSLSTLISPRYMYSTTAFSWGHCTSFMMIIGCWHGWSRNSAWK